MKEPLWKTVLNWGTVVTFLTLPIFVMSLQIYINTHPGSWQWAETGLTPQERMERFKYLDDFLRNITFLVFGLAGLNVWDKKMNGKRTNGDAKKD